MNPRVAALSAFSLAFALSACGPSVRSLVDGRHYREAVCAAHDGVDRALVTDALARDTGLTLHVQSLSDSTLDAVNRSRAVAHQPPVQLLRVDAQSNQLPLDRLELEATIDNDEGLARGALVTLTSALLVTGERIAPGHTVETYLTPSNALRGLAALVTGGLALFVSPMQRERYTVGPTWTEITRTAPMAAALDHVAEHAGCANIAVADRHARCRWYFFVAAEPSERIELAITTRYTAQRSDYQRTLQTCSLTRTQRRALGTAGALSATLSQTFGAHAIAL